MIWLEWRYTYQSARRDSFTRTQAFRKFLREVTIGIRYSIFGYKGKRLQ